MFVALFAGIIWWDWRIHTAFQHRGPIGMESGSPGGGSFCRGNPFLELCKVHFSIYYRYIRCYNCELTVTMDTGSVAH